MKKKYLYNGQLIDESDVMEAAKQSGIDVNSYTQKAGMKPVDDTGWRTIWGGTYAFFSADQTEQEAEEWRAYIAERKATNARMGWGSGNFVVLYEIGRTETLVAGTIKMWGDVVEHEKGYRAEYAKINSLDAIHGPGDLEELRRVYGVASR